jgi:hypothetical protein
MCGQQWQPLSAVPTLWGRLRVVNESGGGRPPRHSPLGGGRAAYEGAQQPSGLELGSFSPHSHDLTASRALSLALFLPRRCHQRRAGALRRAPGAWAAAVGTPRPQWPPIMRMIWSWSSLSSPCKSRAGSELFLVIVGCNGPHVNRCVTAHGG